MSCDVCGQKLGSRGHRCATPYCRGSLIRAKKILEDGADTNGDPIDEAFRHHLDYTIATAKKRA